MKVEVRMSSPQEAHQEVLKSNDENKAMNGWKRNGFGIKTEATTKILPKHYYYTYRVPSFIDFLLYFANYMMLLLSDLTRLEQPQVPKVTHLMMQLQSPNFLPHPHHQFYATEV